MLAGGLVLAGGVIILGGGRPLCWGQLLGMDAGVGWIGSVGGSLYG